VLRRTELKRKTPHKSRRRSTGPDRNTVDAVLERDQWMCAVCGDVLVGQRGIGWSIHHRRPRRAGGDKRPDTNLASNLVAVHGHGTADCHGRIESRRAEAISHGWLLHDGDVPSQTAINHAVHGWCHLTDDGRVEYAPPPVNVGGVIR